MRTSSRRLRFFHYASLSALCGLVGLAACQRPVVQPAPRTGPAQVAGTLTLMVGLGDSNNTDAVAVNNRIELPDVDVYLRNATSGAIEPTKKTQLDGKFYLRAPAPGTYTVCWKAPGIGDACGNGFTVSGEDVYLRAVPVRAPKGGLVYGKALTADGRACWINDPFFNLDVSTLVTLFNGVNRLAQPAVRANTQGEFAFAGLGADKYRVGAACERARGESVAAVAASPVVTNVTLPNRAPRVAGIAAFAGGAGVTRVAAGTTVNVQAIVRDEDQDPIEYLWRSIDGSGSIAATGLAQQAWTAAPTAGLQTVYLIARDGKGGYAYKRFDMQVGGSAVAFSGRVIDETTQTPVGSASVTVNGATATTNAQGWFSLTTAVASPERYVLNINHPQYALLSRVHDRSAAGSTYPLIRVQTTTHNPAAVIDVTDERSGGPCGTGKPAQALPGHGGRQTSQPDTQACRRAGARLLLPAGALVDAQQNPVTGPVTLQFATLNPARRSLPGDYRALTSSNQPGELLSYGALYAQFRDASGRALNLKAGTSAEIRVPVPVEQQSSAGVSIPLWSYDEARGVWVEEGKAALQKTPQGPVYVGQTTHFSSLNMDVSGSDPAQATCVRFELGTSLSGWSNLVVRAYVSYGGTAVQVKETPLNTDQYHAIYRIPYAPPATAPNTLRLELRGTYGGQEVVLLNNVINTDAPRPKMTGTNLWPPYPYTECGAVVTLEADPVNLPYYGDLDATGRPAFLTGSIGQFLPANGEQVATDYYNTIDPGGTTNPTLSAWWTNHGFAADGSGGTRAAYLNHNDLGFGRDMNCKTTGNDLACYVTNYGLPDQNPANADNAENSVAAQRGATVAMEYKASEPADRQVRFFVYGGGDPATAGKLKFADLDGLGPKSVPHLCLVCHGGTYDDVTKNAVQARFREFDLQSFKYSGGRSWDYAPSPDNNNLTANELTAFAELNKMVRDIQPNTSAIKELIDNWYQGNFGAGTKPTQTVVPSGWNSEATVYRNVYGKSCRTCHVARDGGSANAFLNFRTSSNFQVTDYAVCNSPKLMPNAYITYKNFWNDLQRVIDFRNFTGAATCQ